MIWSRLDGTVDGEGYSSGDVKSGAFEYHQVDVGRNSGVAGYRHRASLSWYNQGGGGGTDGGKSL